MDKSEWWQGELADDIYRVLREKELSLPRFCARSPQLHLRRYFVDLLATLSEHLQLSVATHHLAISMLDMFMDRHNITVRCLYTCSICCLIIAACVFLTPCTAKFEEKIEQVPRLDWVNRLEVMTKRGLSLSKKELQQTEFMLLRTFNWNLCMPTAAHYVDYFLWLTQREDTAAGGSNGHQQSSLSYQHAYMIKYMAHFLQLSLQDHVFLSFRPSVVAAASIALARMGVKLASAWTLHMQHCTGLAWEMLLPCVSQLICKYNFNSKQVMEFKEKPAVHSERPSHSASAVPHVPLHQSTKQQQPPQQQRWVLKLCPRSLVPAKHPVPKPVQMLRPPVEVGQEMEPLLFCKETLGNTSDNHDMAAQAVCQQESGHKATQQIDQQAIQCLILRSRQGTDLRNAEHRAGVGQSSARRSFGQQAGVSSEPVDYQQSKRRKISATVANLK
ncbi:cyclin-J-like isoform X1 [Petromyzon marinus]|uniref:cyclin-J-like isoform X1 n=1 Tax=Petromyzon marinus TaxID=7757 RepID=UPI003F6F62FF